MDFRNDFPLLGFDREYAWEKGYRGCPAPDVFAAVWWHDELKCFETNVYHASIRMMHLEDTSKENRIIWTQEPMRADSPLQACALIHNIITRYRTLQETSDDLQTV
jgi:hypothetical protein